MQGSSDVGNSCKVQNSSDRRTEKIGKEPNEWFV